MKNLNSQKELNWMLKDGVGKLKEEKTCSNFYQCENENVLSTSNTRKL